MCNKADKNEQQGFTLIELVCVLVLVGLLSVTLVSRYDNTSISSALQAGRDDLITALFFAQQTAMARSNIQTVVTSSAVSVTESGTPIVVSKYGYPLSFPSGVTATAATFTYDKLGQTTAATITLSDSGLSVVVTVETTGYAH